MILARDGVRIHCPIRATTPGSRRKLGMAGSPLTAAVPEELSSASVLEHLAATTVRCACMTEHRTPVIAARGPSTIATQPKIAPNDDWAYYDTVAKKAYSATSTTPAVQISDAIYFPSRAIRAHVVLTRRSHPSAPPHPRRSQASDMLGGSSRQPRRFPAKVPCRT